MKFNSLAPLALLTCLLIPWPEPAAAQSAPDGLPVSEIKEIIDSHYDDLEALYRHFHANPELSLQEEETSSRLAAELRGLGFLVTENVGGHGIVGVFENGEGPVVLVRSDMDALPMREETGVAFASTRTAIAPGGEETPVMHACGHDMHMTTLSGTARVLTELRDRWSGTLVFIGQPAEELLSGARAMIADGLFERFPAPDAMLALHVSSALPSGEVGFSHGYAYANVDMGRIVVRGVGGHGAYPNLTVDPVVLASRLVLGLQSIVTREFSATEMVNLNVGSVRGGSSPNIIPEEVVLEVALNVHGDEQREKLIRRIGEMNEGLGRSAGLPEELWPRLELDEDNRVASVYNHPELGRRLESLFTGILGEERFHETPPLMYGEDFGEYGRALPDVPALLFGVGAIDPDLIEEAGGDWTQIPSTHSPRFLPHTGPTLRTGILTMSGAVLDLLGGE